MWASLILLNTISPSKLADDRILYGYQVWEALVDLEFPHSAFIIEGMLSMIPSPIFFDSRNLK